MDDVDYKMKYIKYKVKYLQLLEELEGGLFGLTVNDKINTIKKSLEKPHSVTGNESKSYLTKNVFKVSITDLEKKLSSEQFQKLEEHLNNFINRGSTSTFKDKRKKVIAIWAGEDPYILTETLFEKIKEKTLKK